MTSLDAPLSGYSTSEVATLQPLGEISEFRGEITVRVRREQLLAVLKICRDDLRFELCTGVSTVHYPHDHGVELHAVYHLLSMTFNRRIRIDRSSMSWIFTLHAPGRSPGRTHQRQPH